MNNELTVHSPHNFCYAKSQMPHRQVFQSQKKKQKIIILWKKFNNDAQHTMVFRDENLVRICQKGVETRSHIKRRLTWELRVDFFMSASEEISNNNVIHHSPFNSYCSFNLNFSPNCREECMYFICARH